MTKKILIMVSVVMLIALVGCSQETVEVTTTTKPKATTEKATITQKVTTTKATTEPPYFCDEGGTHHSCRVGPIGWTSSFDEAKQKALRYIDDHADSGSFRVTQCQYCGKYSANITLDKKEEHNMPCGNVGKWYSSKRL